MKIIAVDDERGALRLLTNAIEKVEPGAELYGLIDVDEALECAREVKPDIAFLDIQMAGTNGLDLAKLLKDINPLMNIIFTTGYSEYATEAFSLKASGYLLKPVSVDDVRKELDALRYPVDDKSNGLYFRTFGNFCPYYDGSIIRFKYEKTRELLAYIYDKQGEMTYLDDIEVALWDDGRIHDAYLRQIKKDLLDTFDELGCKDVIYNKRGELGLDVEKINSDYRGYMEGRPEATQAYNDDYMPRFVWAEYRNAKMQLDK